MTTSNPKGYHLEGESFPMPPTRADRIAAIESILAPGGVQKLVIELGKGIRILRWVKDDGPPLSNELINDTLMSATRNAEMLGMESKGVSAVNDLVNALNMVADFEHRPRAIAVQSKKEFEAWLKEPSSRKGDVFCIPVMEHKSIPDETILIIASSQDDQDDITFSVRLEMAKYEEKK